MKNKLQIFMFTLLICCSLQTLCASTPISATWPLVTARSSVTTTTISEQLISMHNVSGVTTDPPTITTTAVSNISTTFVTTGATISSNGGATVTESGIVYSTTNTTPTTNDSIAASTDSTSFTTQLTGLTAGTTYYIRAFATNSAGTSYGNVVTFTTLAALVVPTLTTSSVSSILAKTATSGGNVSVWGGSPIVTRGICWSATQTTPTIADSTCSFGSGTGSFSCSLSQLLPSTTYYVCAYATNSTGTGYGSVVSFTTKAVAPDVIKTVGKDANSNYNTIQAAFSAVPSNYTGRWIIYVKNGTYIEKDELTSTKPNVYLIGQNVDSCIITYNNYAGIPSASGGTIGTTNSYSVAIDASDFYAQNITFQNTIENTGKNTFSSGGDQAVALRTEGDRQQYYNCRLLGYQDTYYTNSSGRIYMKDCYIAGSVDFIFGDGTMILDSCTTYCNRSGGINCAPNTLATSSFGYVFRNCTLTSLAAGTLDFTGTAFVNYYLGRPWQNNPKAAYITCSEPATINPLGWATMTSGLNPFFAEYNCTGPGSAFSGRCTTFTSGYDFAGQQLTGTQAATYTTSNIFSKNTNPSFSYNWLPSPMTDIIDTITIIIPTNGTLTVSNGTTQLHSGDVVPTGASLTVTATPNTNYNISTLTANETSISSTYTVAKSTTFNATFNVTSGLETISSGTNQLNQNVPNPVVTSSVISYSIAQDCQVTLTVTNTLGRKIATLVNALKSAGAYSINVNEAMFPTGIYFYTLQAGNFSQTKTMIVR